MTWADFFYGVVTGFALGLIACAYAINWAIRAFLRAIVTHDAD